MKAFQVFLVFCLFATFTCNEFVDFVLCLVADPKINELIIEIIEKIKNKAHVLDFVQYAISKIPDIEVAAKKCLNK
jgi:hypothetical protein